MPATLPPAVMPLSLATATPPGTPADALKPEPHTSAAAAAASVSGAKAAASSSKHAEPTQPPSPAPSQPLPPPAQELFELVDIRGYASGGGGGDSDDAAGADPNAAMARAVLDGLTRKTVPYRAPRPSDHDDSDYVNDDDAEYDEEREDSASAPGATLLRSIPTLVLYDDRGLELFDEITYLDEYYLTAAEIDVFARWADEMMRTCVSDGGVLIELGVGSMRKTRYLLEALVRQGKSATYYALDVSASSLSSSLAPLAAKFPTIRFVGLLGTYDDALAHIADWHDGDAAASRTLLWLGSSIGNLPRRGAAAFLAQVRELAMRPGDTLLVGIDRRNAPRTIRAAYDDAAGVTREFCLNGLDHVDRILSGDAEGAQFGADDGRRSRRDILDRERFAYVSVYNRRAGRHEAYYRSLQAQTVVVPANPSLGLASETRVELAEGELVHVEFSVKYSLRETATLARIARLYSPGRWEESLGRYDVHVFQCPPFWFEAAPPEGGEFKGVPTVEEFEELWKAWDHVTGTMIAPGDELERPIALRHPYVFYLGHAPGFTDIQLARALGEQVTAPAEYADIFERGIDPLVGDPDVCHSHSRVPDQWPAVADVLLYRDRARARVRRVLTQLKEVADGKSGVLAAAPIGRVARAAWMCYEHEAMHLETLLYMLAQSPRVRPPAHVLPPIGLFRAATADGDKLALPSPLPLGWVRIGGSDGNIVETGHDDDEAGDAGRGAREAVREHEYGWDNEHPRRQLALPTGGAWLADRAVTVGEYFAFVCDVAAGRGGSWDPEAARAAGLVPASWEVPEVSAATDGATTTVPLPRVRTVFGPAPLARAAAWGAVVSRVQADAYAAWASRAAGSRLRLPSEAELLALRDVVAAAAAAGSSVVAADDVRANHGFRSWTPQPARRHAQPGSSWEWTSTTLAAHEGYATSVAYPGYTSDFFDGAHAVVGGGASWATAPRMARRRAFRNWFQPDYPFAFVGFRLARDAGGEEEAVRA
ncbi:hypothetical protein HK405_008709 [Cladochytrium tenue]|nr:hypothetical protein HK405_008709 [Cladochytrium tenue]